MIFGLMISKEFFNLQKEETPIYIYDPNGKSKNTEQLEFFVENTNNKLRCSLLMKKVEEEIPLSCMETNITYGIQNNIDDITLYVINWDTKETLEKRDYTILQTIEINDYKYFILTNEDTSNDKFEDYLNDEKGLDIFILGKEKI